MHSCSSLENHTRFHTKMGKVYTRFQTKKGSKTLVNPLGGGGGGAHSFMAYIRKYSPGLKSFPSGSTHLRINHYRENPPYLANYVIPKIILAGFFVTYR